MNQDFPDDDILIEVKNGVAVVALNRTKLLNALSIDMIRKIASSLHRWREDDSVHAVIFKGLGGKAFCAGGDVKSFYSAGMECRKGLVSPRVPVVFFAEEYSLNKQIFNYPKPIISLMNGITMGGGYGIAGHSRYRVAMENTVFAMPEVAIGFFPDIGSVYHLLKCPSFFGHYLALTGLTIRGPEMCAAGLADYYTEQSLGEIEQALYEGNNESDIKDILQSLHVKDELKIEHEDVIRDVFSKGDVAAVIDALRQDGSEFAMKTLGVMKSRSPSSLRVTAEYLKRAEGLSFDEVIAMDFMMVQHFIQNADLYEGIRAKLIDKDHAPRWDPPKLEDLSVDDVNAYFTSTGYDLSDVQIFNA